MSDSPYRFSKISIFKVISQKGLRNPCEILVITCWKLRNTKGWYSFICHYSRLPILPIKSGLPDSNRFIGGEVNNWILGSLEKMMGHIEEHMLMGIFLSKYFGWEFLNREIITHFPFYFTIMYTCSALWVWIEWGSMIVGSACRQSLEFSL